MGSLLALSLAIDARDRYTSGHSARVTEFALAIARRLTAGRALLEALQVGGPLHDIGKVGIAEEILLKPGPLDDAELDLIRTHPRTGAELIADIPSLPPRSGASSTITSAGTAAATRRVSPAPISRSRPASWPSRMRSTP
jgi:HD-GYP domain-containing protein (c-di-GMP phosphodiesterase class II)